MNNFRQPFWNAEQPNKFVPSKVVCSITAFTLANDVDTTATIVAEYPITNTTALTLERPFMEDFADTSYLVAVRYVDDAGNVYRYILYAPEDFAILYPTYAGESIGSGAIIEIWANPADALITASADITFNLNAVTLYGQTTTALCFCTTLDDSTLTLEQTVISPQSTGPCNPFCDCAELAAG